MKIPATLPHFRTAIFVLGVYAAAWMVLEGEIWRDILLAMGIMGVGSAYFVGRRWGGRMLSPARGMILATVAGLCCGGGIAIVTLSLMALKTGLHAHGPEYTAQEVAWVLRQVPFWAGAGGFTGLGLGAIGVAHFSEP